MRQGLKLVLLMVAVLVQTTWALANPQPSFLCSDATSNAQQAICFSEELSKLDIDMARAYQGVLAAAVDKAAVKSEQTQWLTQRDNCQSSECIKALYIDRIAALTSQNAAAKKAGAYVVANTDGPDHVVDLQSKVDTATEYTVTQIPEGTEVEVLQRDVDGWVHVRIIATGQVGWVFSGTSKKRFIVWRATNGDGIDAATRKGGTYIIANNVAPNNYLELRSETSQSSGRVIAKLANGTPVKILQRGVTGWVHIQVTNSRQTGWVNAGNKAGNKALIIWRPDKAQTDLPKTGSYVIANTGAPSFSAPLRTQPSVSVGVAMAQLPNGTKVQVLQPSVEGWVYVQVTATAQKGWVFSGTSLTRYIIWQSDNALIDASKRQGGTYIIANTTAPNNFLPMYSDTSTTTGRMVAKLANGTPVQILQPAITGWVHVQVTESRMAGWVNVGSNDKNLILWRPDLPKTGSYVIANQLPPKFSATLRTTPNFSDGSPIAELPNGTEVLVLQAKVQDWVAVQVVATGQKGYVFSNTLDNPYIVWQDADTKTQRLCNAQNLQDCSAADLCFAINVVTAGSDAEKQALRAQISQGKLRLNPVFLDAFNRAILAGLTSETARDIAKKMAKAGDIAAPAKTADGQAFLRDYYQAVFGDVDGLANYIGEALQRPYACPRI